MKEKRLNIVLPNIYTIKETIDIIRDCGNITDEMINNIRDRYWAVNTINNPELLTVFVTDILTSSIKHHEEYNIYLDLKDEYGETLVDRFIHKEYDFGDKFVKLITSIMEKEELDSIVITVSNEDLGNMIVDTISGMSGYDIIVNQQGAVDNVLTDFNEVILKQIHNN